MKNKIRSNWHLLKTILNILYRYNQRNKKYILCVTYTFFNIKLKQIWIYKNLIKKDYNNFFTFYILVICWISFFRNVLNSKTLTSAYDKIEEQSTLVLKFPKFFIFIKRYNRFICRKIIWQTTLNFGKIDYLRSH